MSICNYHETQTNRYFLPMEGGQPTPRPTSISCGYPMPQCSKPNQPSGAAAKGKILPTVNHHAGGNATRGGRSEKPATEAILVPVEPSCRCSYQEATNSYAPTEVWISALLSGPWASRTIEPGINNDRV